jgi:hypothetical protein
VGGAGRGGQTVSSGLLHSSAITHNHHRTLYFSGFEQTIMQILTVIRGERIVGLKDKREDTASCCELAPHVAAADHSESEEVQLG